MSPSPNFLRPVDMGDLPEYPLSCDDRLDSHFFMAWERRRWLASDMRLNATPECRALFFDLINIAYDNSPVGTLPMDQNILAKLLMIDPRHFGSPDRAHKGRDELETARGHRRGRWPVAHVPDGWSAQRLHRCAGASEYSASRQTHAGRPWI